MVADSVNYWRKIYFYLWKIYADVKCRTDKTSGFELYPAGLAITKKIELLQYCLKIVFIFENGS